MARTGVRIDGLSELHEALRELPDATAKNVLRRVGRKRLQPIVDMAVALAPYKTGRLRSRITVGTRLSKRQRSMYEPEGKYDITIFGGAAGARHAHLQEFGTRHHKAQPFLQPAWDAGKDAMLEGLKDDLWAEIEKAAARLARKAAKAAAKGV